VIQIWSIVKQHISIGRLDIWSLHLELLFIEVFKHLFIISHFICFLFIEVMYKVIHVCIATLVRILLILDDHVRRSHEGTMQRVSCHH